MKHFRSIFLASTRAMTRWLDYCRTHPRANMAIKTAAVFFLFWVACWRKLDPDFGWHLQAGNYFRAHGIPSHDVFSYTAPDFPWIDHEWLSDILVSLLYGAGGFVLLATVFAALWTTAVFISGSKVRFVVLLLAFEAMLPYAAVRPIAWTVLGLAIGMRLLGSKNWQRLAWFMLPLILIWTNLHGGFILGLGLLGYYTLRYRSWQLAIISIIAVLVTFINPYGINLYTEIFNTLSDPTVRFQISEWQGFAIPEEAMAFILLWVAGFWLYGRQKWLNWLTLSPFFLLSSLSTTRNVPLFAISAMRELDDYIGRAKALLPKKLNRPRKVIVVGAQLFLVSWIGYILYGHLVDSSWNLESRSPVQVVSYLQEHPCEGRLFNAYSYGGYLIWKLPGTPIYIDGRMPIWRDKSNKKYMDTYIKMGEDPAVRRAEFEKYSITCVVVSSQPGPFIDALKKEGWKSQVVGDEGSVLLVKP